jgi:hypothetical protein
MKKAIIFGALASLAVVSGIAHAGTPGSSNGQSLKMTGLGKQASQGGAAGYNDPFFGPNTRCNETQHPTFDTVSCTLATPNLSLAGTSGTVGWYSDFNGNLGTFTYTVSADGLSYSGKATY